MRNHPAIQYQQIPPLDAVAVSMIGCDEARHCRFESTTGYLRSVLAALASVESQFWCSRRRAFRLAASAPPIPVRCSSTTPLPWAGCAEARCSSSWRRTRVRARCSTPSSRSRAGNQRSRATWPASSATLGDHARRARDVPQQRVSRIRRSRPLCSGVQRRPSHAVWIPLGRLVSDGEPRPHAPSWQLPWPRRPPRSRTWSHPQRCT